MECVLAKMPSGDRLVKLDELASDKGQGLDYKYYADRLLKEAELSKDDTYKGNALFQIIRYYYSRNIDSMYFFIKKAEPIYLAQNVMRIFAGLKDGIFTLYRVMARRKGC